MQPCLCLCLKCLCLALHLACSLAHCPRSGINRSLHETAGGSCATLPVSGCQHTQAIPGIKEHSLLHAAGSQRAVATSSCIVVPGNKYAHLGPILGCVSCFFNVTSSLAGHMCCLVNTRLWRAHRIVEESFAGCV